MQLIKLVIELCNHLLDISTFLLSIDLLEDCHLDILLREQSLLHQREVGLLHEDVLDLGISIPG